MKVFVVTRATLTENNVYADAYVGKDRSNAIKAAVEGFMLDWWRDYNSDGGAEDEDDGVGAVAYETIFSKYCTMFRDEEKIEVNEEEVMGI